MRSQRRLSSSLTVFERAQIFMGVDVSYDVSFATDDLVLLCSKFDHALVEENSRPAQIPQL